jgi:hypothetical protein
LSRAALLLLEKLRRAKALVLSMKLKLLKQRIEKPAQKLTGRKAERADSSKNFLPR